MTQVLAKVLNMSGKAVAVQIGCDAYVIDMDTIGVVKVGTEVSIDIVALENATPYGIDWSIIYPEGLTISPDALQALMCKYGIITFDDLMCNASMLQSILAHETKRLSVELYNRVKSVI